MLEGSVRREGDRVRVTATLVRVDKQTLVWTQNYDNRLQDVLATQSEISHRIVAALVPRMVSSGKLPLVESRSVNPAAYDAYLKAVFFRNKLSPAATKRALELFQESAELDPEFAPAYAGLASAYSILAHMRVLRPREAFAKAKAAANEAVRLDPTSAAAHTQAAFIKLHYQWDWTGAEQTFQHAIQLNPSEPLAHLGYSGFFQVQGRFDEARAELEQLREVDPLSFFYITDSCELEYFARQYDRAVALCRQAQEMDSTSTVPYWNLVRIYSAMGMPSEAQEAYLKVLPQSGTSQEFQAMIAEGCRAGGWNGCIRKALQDALARRGQQDYFPAYQIAVYYAWLGENDRAMDWLEKGYEERYYRMEFLKVEPVFDSLRDNPRFQDLLRRMNLH